MSIPSLTQQSRLIGHAREGYWKGWGRWGGQNKRREIEERKIWITRDHHWSNYSASWTVCRWDCEWPRAGSATATECRAMMSRDGNARRPDDCHPRRRRRSRRCRSRRPSRPGTSRCCRSSPPSALDTRLEETRRG